MYVFWLDMIGMAMRMRIGCLSEMCAAYIALYPTYVGLCGSMRIGKYIRMANPNINGPHTVYIPLTPWSYKDLRSSSFCQPSVMILYGLCIDKSSNSKGLSWWGKSQELFWGSNFSQMFSSECLVLACRLCLPCQDNQVLASVRRRMSMLWVHTIQVVFFIDTE